MISQKSKYAIRAVLYLSIESDPKVNRINGKAISKALKMPLAFTVKILQELARNNIISSTKGPGGGFYLSKQNEGATLMDIIRVFGDERYFTHCALDLPSCSDEHPCPIHHGIKKSRVELKKIFEKKTIEQLKKDIRKDSLVLVL